MLMLLIRAVTADGEGGPAISAAVGEGPTAASKTVAGPAWCETSGDEAGQPMCRLVRIPSLWKGPLEHSQS